MTTDREPFSPWAIIAISLALAFLAGIASIAAPEWGYILGGLASVAFTFGFISAAIVHALNCVAWKERQVQRIAEYQASQP